MSKLRPDIAQLKFCALPDDAELYVTAYGGKYPGDRIEMVTKGRLGYNMDRGSDAFCYVWGWPGPDANLYYFSDYGKTWAFRMEDFEGDANADE